MSAEDAGRGADLTAPFYVLHYKKNAERKRYLDEALSKTAIRADFILDFDQGEFDLSQVYQFDPAVWDRMVEPIKDHLIGNVLALTQRPHAPWSECVQAVKRLRLSLAQAYERCPWLRPRPLSPGDVSLFLKHRAAWEKIAKGSADWGIIAEDDIIFTQQSAAYLGEIVTRLPQNLDYVDLAGGGGFFPRRGNPLVNGNFYRVNPPGSRTTCCALIAQKFAARLVAITLPICLPIDWTLNAAFGRTQAQVYWVHPLVFGHGSQLKVYKSHQG